MLNIIKTVTPRYSPTQIKGLDYVKNIRSSSIRPSTIRTSTIWGENVYVNAFSPISNVSQVVPTRTLSINLISTKLTGIQVELEEILEAVEQSKYILGLEDDWDGEGSQKYNPNVWERVAIFLIKLSQKAFTSFSIILNAPIIYHANNGSIDVLWKNERYQLLANFPEDDTSPASFYGDNYYSDTIEGTFDPLKGECSLMVFLVWAMRCIQ